MTTRMGWAIVPWLLLGCAEDGGMTDATTLASTSDDEATRGPGATSSSGPGDSSGSGLVDESTGTPGDGGDPPAGVVLRTTFTIPAGTVVEEFSFAAPVELSPTVLSGETVVVAVRDLSHPERDQGVLCPGSHPLDGCATVDYGAFGTTHDNRITFDGPDGPWSIHLYKDRTLDGEPEPLPLNE